MHNKQTNPPVPPPVQGSYLFRYWKTSETSPLRFMLKSVTTGEQLMFRDLSELIEFLQTKGESNVG